MSVFHVSGLAELKELVFAGLNRKQKSSLREYARTSYAVSHFLNAKRIGNYFAPSSALKTLAHFASSPHRSVKTDWPYSKDWASSARTSSVRSIYGQDGAYD